MPVWHTLNPARQSQLFKDEQGKTLDIHNFQDCTRKFSCLLWNNPVSIFDINNQKRCSCMIFHHTSNFWKKCHPSINQKIYPKLCDCLRQILLTLWWVIHGPHTLGIAPHLSQCESMGLGERRMIMFTNYVTLVMQSNIGFSLLYFY